MKSLLNYIIILSFLGFFITSCNTGVDGRYKQMYSFIGSGEFYFDKDGTYTFEMEWNDNPSIMGTGGTKKGDKGKDEGTWWLDTTDIGSGKKVTFDEFKKDPKRHNVWINYKMNGSKSKTHHFLIKNRDSWYPDLWRNGEKAYFKAFLPF